MKNKTLKRFTAYNGKEKVVSLVCTKASEFYAYANTIDLDPTLRAEITKV